MTKDKIFISHSSKDNDYVKSFVENILLLGLDIPSDRIFCSSMEGQGVKSGQYIPDRLKEEINKSSLALLFVSKNYKSSEICLNEVGAAWATLKKESVIPMLLPNAEFSELGFLDLSRLGLKCYEREGILKLIQDCKDELNPSFNLEKLHKKIEDYLGKINKLIKQETTSLTSESEEVDEWTDCFTNNLYPLNEIIRKAIPAHEDGIHKIEDIKTQNQILTDLSQAKFLRHFWYKQAGGDYYVEKLRKLPTGNWLISGFNWEVKITEMWVCMYSELQYEFILIKSAELEPYKIDSDIGGTSYNVGILKDGTIVSENERQNGYAIINGETVNLHEHGVEPRVRDDESHWVFLVSDYHKAGYNADETIEFCEKLDKGEIEVNEENIYQFLRSLRNNPVVIRYR
ncbi:toll/interleukin-1 receptor domain-containing protein [Pararhodonellum marinum]|uniref:toll/interleukin-1 receptor domain-containing protein n=1 Tax=Pararhodonellum marinum TaxID=2755358 RepID=UPI00188F8D55|nr:toll/interleukin-1 receptor domain-containing protein [Pararhodonellum marinum]